MGNTNDLDLSKIEDNDLDRLAQEIENHYKRDTAQKQSLAYSWERVHLMLEGNQWLTYEGNRDSGGVWKRLVPMPANEYIPRPVTNYLFDAYQTLKGYLLKNSPRITVRPNSLTNKDRTAAKLAELVAETNWERLHEDENYESACSVLQTYGTVFKKDYWDNSYTSLAKVPKMVQMPTVDPATGQQTGMQEVQAVDPQTGMPLFDELPLGDVATTVVEPYRVALDPLAINLHDSRWIMEYSIRPISWILENYDKQEPGYTGRANEVQPEKSAPSSLRRFLNLRTSSGVKGHAMAGGVAAENGDSNMPDETAVVKEYYAAPTAKHPKGRLIVVANSIPLFAGGSPYEGPEAGDWHPYSECRWEIVPGRFWAKGPLDEAVEIQKQINSIDSVIILTRKTMAVPQKLIPRGSIRADNSWTGKPGLEVPYTAVDGMKPETVQPSGVHETVFQERAQKVEDIKNITGAIDILKGDRPPGVTAASALEMLFEVGTGKLQPVMKRWKRFIESSQKKQLKLIAKKYREPRPEFVQMLLSKNKDLTESQVKDFIGSDLNDNCNVIIEASSSIPKLLAAERAKLMEVAQMGVLNLQDPRNKSEFLERQGIIGFDSDWNKDANRASWENGLLDHLMSNPDNKPILLVTDNHEIHKAVHSDRTKEPSFIELPIEIQQAYFQHIQEHENAIAQEQQMQMMQAAMTGQPPQPPPNPMGQPESIRKGPTPPKMAREALNADLKGPAALPGE